MQQIIFIALTAIILALILKEIGYTVRAMRYHQFQAKKLNIPFDIYAMEFEAETKKYLYMDKKYNG
jgi:hypothetical protein